MARNIYPGKTISELLPIRERIMEARTGGSIVSVGISAGIRNDFAPMKRADLDIALLEVDYALFLLEPETYSNPYAGKTMKISTVYS